MKTKTAKAFLTIAELSEQVGRTYATVRGWILAGRITTRSRRTAKSVIHRIPAKEAERVKRLIESGEWGVE